MCEIYSGNKYLMTPRVPAAIFSLCLSLKNWNFFFQKIPYFFTLLYYNCPQLDRGLSDQSSWFKINISETEVILEVPYHIYGVEILEFYNIRLSVKQCLALGPLSAPLKSPPCFFFSWELRLLTSLYPISQPYLKNYFQGI